MCQRTNPVQRSNVGVHEALKDQLEVRWGVKEDSDSESGSTVPRMDHLGNDLDRFGRCLVQREKLDLCAVVSGCSESYRKGRHVWFMTIAWGFS